MLAPRGSLFVAVLFTACGARSGFEGEQTSVVFTAPWCPRWMPTQPAVQISDSNITQVLAAEPTATGVLVGYSAIEIPSPDPTWRIRRVAWADGALGSSNATLPRNASVIGWTRISIASGQGRSAATAWDATSQMLFVPIDAAGAPTASPTRSPGDPGRDLLVTAAGYSVLRMPFDSPRAPVSLAALDGVGRVVSTRELVDASSPIRNVARKVFGDRSFLLTWLADDSSCAGCRIRYAQHFTEAGDAIAARVVVRSYEPTAPFGDAIAVSSTGFVAAWFERSGSDFVIMTAPFDTDGVSLGNATQLRRVPGPNTGSLELASSPGGDLIVVWNEGFDNAHQQILAQSLTPRGLEEGVAVLLGQLSASADERVLVTAANEGAMVLYGSEVPRVGSTVFAIPMRCAR